MSVTVSTIRTGADVPDGIVAAPAFSGLDPAFVTTSATKMVPSESTGTIALSVDSPYLSYTTGARVRAVSASTGYWVEGVVASYAGSLLTIRRDRSFGPPDEYQDWVINIVGAVATSAVSSAVVDAKITETRANGAATFHLKTLSGNDPSAENPVTVFFPSGTLRRIKTQLSVTIPSGVTLGTATGIAYRIWIVLWDEAGFDAHLAVYHSRITANNEIISFPGNGLLTTVTPPADTSGVFYSDLAGASKPFVVVGYFEYDSGLATAGVWNAAPSRFVLYAPGSALPGAVLQELLLIDSATVSAPSFIIPLDNTIPQATEGNLFMSLSVLPRAAMSLLQVDVQAYHNYDVGDTGIGTLIRSHAGGQPDALATCWHAGQSSWARLSARNFLSGYTTATFQYRGSKSVGATFAFNSASNLGGTMNSFMRLTELMT